MKIIESLVNSSALQPLFAQWNQLSVRDRIALKALAGFFGLFLLYSFAIKPVFDFEKDQKAYFESRLAFLKEVKSKEPQLVSARSSGKKASVASTSLINRVAKSHRLAIKQISPDRDNQVRATFENVEAKSLLALVQDLSNKHSVLVVQASIDRRSPGKVNAKLVFGS